MTHVNQMATGLDLLCDLSLAMDAEGEGAQLRYNDEDAMNALQVFMHVTQNILFHNMCDKGIHGDPAVRIATKRAHELKRCFYGLTGIDSGTFYQDKP